MKAFIRPRLLISFSGGRTSAYMLLWLWFEWPDRAKWDKIVIFANTGKEHEDTLRFVRNLSVRWHIPIIWVEAKHRDTEGKTFSKRGWSVRAKVVSFETASRNGEPFEEMISVLGIPSTNSPFCSPQLKRAAIMAYLRQIGWRKYYTAIGIRSDEVDRMNANFRKQRLMYPLISMFPTTKEDVLNYWSNVSRFDLKVDPDQGNCDNCWKKNLNLLVRNTRNHPESFDWWQEMTDKYGMFEPRKMKKIKPPFNFFRGNMSPDDLFAVAKMKDEVIARKAQEERLDGCATESCEAF